MKRILLWILLVAGVWLLWQLPKGQCPLKLALSKKEVSVVPVVIEEKKSAILSEGLALLKSRKDNQAYAVFEDILKAQPESLGALWGKAEVLRRNRAYKESSSILAEILDNNPRHAPSLISLSYIRYKEDNLDDAQNLLGLALKAGSLKEDKALANLMLGTINSRRAEKGWFFNKIKYGTQIKYYFLKARELAPQLPEVRLGLGTFYLKAPSFIGGNLDKALEELEAAVEIAPDFATANARLAQAYKKKGLIEKYNFHLNRARELDPDNEVLKEN